MSKESKLAAMDAVDGVNAIRDIVSSDTTTDEVPSYYKKKWAEVDAIVTRLRQRVRLLSAALTLMGADDPHECFGSSYVTVGSELREARIRLQDATVECIYWASLERVDPEGILAKGVLNPAYTDPYFFDYLREYEKTTPNDPLLLRFMKNCNVGRIDSVVKVAKEAASKAWRVASEMKRVSDLFADDLFERHAEYRAVHAILENESRQTQIVSQLEPLVAGYAALAGDDGIIERIQWVDKLVAEDGETAENDDEKNEKSE